MSEEIIKKRLSDIIATDLSREIPRIRGSGTEVEVNSRRAVLFCSNDYLGLSVHPAVTGALREAVEDAQAGSAASRLVSGDRPEHEELEKRFASFMKVERARLFSTGYQANVGVLSALAQKGDLIFSDELNHASIIDGARLSRADVVVYGHRDVEDLEKKIAGKHTGGLKIIVSDAVFSMDGDPAPLAGLVDLARRYGAIVYLDEAHSFGLMGKGGRGLAFQEQVDDKVDIRLVTFGKAMGLCGAVVLASSDVISLVTNTARSLLYSTSMPSYIARSAMASLDQIEKGDEVRKKLRQNVRLFRELSIAAGLEITDSVSPIQPLITGTEQRGLRASRMMLDRGYFIQAIRPPTVAPGTSRLRITLSALHTQKQISGLIENLCDVLK